MSIIVMPKTVVTLSEFLESHGLTLLVRETGSSKWEASFDPDVLEDSGEEDEDGAQILTHVTVEGESTQEAIKLMCEFLSGNDDLCIDEEDSPADLDLYYTRVEYDEGGVEIAVENEADPGNLMRATMRHHGGE